MKTILIAAAAVCAFVGTSAQAATMTFSGVTTTAVYNTPYVENGITMTPVVANGYYYGFASNGSAHMDAGSGNGTYDFTFNGGVFDLASIDVAVSYGSGTGTFTAFDALGSQIGVAAFSTSTTGTKALGLTGVSRARLVASGTHFNIDNLVLNASSGAVPEPATWAMMTLGFGAMGFAMRRKKVGTRIRFA